MGLLQAFAQRRRRVFFGWYIVAASSGLVVLVATTVFSYGIFFAEIRSAFGWSSTSTSAAFSFQRLQGGVAQPLAGFLVDRVGTRIMVFVGILLIGLGWIWLSQVDSLWEFYAAIIVSALGMSIGFGVPFNAALVNWFRRGRSRAVGLVWSGTPLAGLLVGVVGILVIQLGWREAALIVGITILAIGLPLSLVIRHRPEPHGYLPDGDAPPASSQGGARLRSSAAGLTVAEALRARAFWIISVGIGVESLAISSLIVHQVAHMKEAGLGTGAATTVVSVGAAAFIVGRLPYALVGHRLDLRLLLVAVFLLAAVAVGAFAYPGEIWTIGVYVGIFGVAHGIITPLRSVAVADYFGTRAFGAISGLFEVPSVVSGIAGPVLLGWVFDWRGEYTPAILGIAALLALTAPVFLFLHKPPYKGIEAPTLQG